MPEIGTSGLMSGDGKRSVGKLPQATAPVLDSTKPPTRGENAAPRTTPQERRPYLAIRREPWPEITVFTLWTVHRAFKMELIFEQWQLVESVKKDVASEIRLQRSTNFTRFHLSSQVALTQTITLLPPHLFHGYGLLSAVYTEAS